MDLDLDLDYCIEVSCPRDKQDETAMAGWFDGVRSITLSVEQ